MSMIYNAGKHGAPLVVTVGQQDTRFMATEPLLSADLVRFAQPWVRSCLHCFGYNMYPT
jgi:thiamine pyrophosphate-dependent acetolactate synthase large subunit-like protein